MKPMSEKIELKWSQKSSDVSFKYNSLIEIEDKSYKGQKSLNMLIHGDNLDALEILSKDYENKIKCIYIDPPYNSLINFQHYNDNYTHEDWLTMMYPRLSLFQKLLRDDGYIFVQIDNRELHYLKVIMDEIFGRDNYRNSIIVRKIYDRFTVNRTQRSFQTGYDTILLYTKSTSTFVPNIQLEHSLQEEVGIWKNFWCSKQNAENNYVLFEEQPENGSWLWNETKTKQSVKNYDILFNYSKKTQDFENDVLFTRLYFNYIKQHNITEEFNIVRKRNGRIEYFIPPSISPILGDDWTDIIVQGKETGFEHEVSEDLLARIIINFTKENDIVLDAFLGSGTTAAVSQKNNRTWIGIEYGEHCYSHCIPRLNKIIDKQCLNGEKIKNLGYRFFELFNDTKLRRKNNETEK